METQASLRFLLVVHYDGSGFHGWQVQPEFRTVQGELESALARLADSPRTVLGSGRTDTGVHAVGQVAAVDMPPRWDAPSLHRSLNAVLPDDIWVETVRAVPEDFHPRYDARARTYTYALGTEPGAASPFHKRWCWPLCTPVEGRLLVEAASHLVGRHSFKAFAKSGQPERGEFCTVREARWEPTELGYRFRITADRYLHHMVRYLVGTMVDVGRQRRPPGDIAALLQGAKGVETSPPAPPQGLFLTRVVYPELPPLESDAYAFTEARSTIPL